MSVAIAINTPPSAPATTAANDPFSAAAPTPTLWELGSELQAEATWIARLSERLDTDDDDQRALAIADLEQSLALEHNKRDAFLRKADATCWVIERLRAEASYHQGQSRRFAALAKREDSRADALESTLIHLLSRLDPTATSHQLVDHRLSSRTTEAIEIDDPEALPPELLTVQTTTTANKASIKARIRAAIAAATAGLPQSEAAQLAFSLAQTAIPGARLIKRRHWSIT
jgi:hypothetical protein